MLRLAGSLKPGWVTASLVIQKLQASPRKSKLAKALQEYGRLVKTLHILSWYESEEKRRWANRQLNKGEAVHSLKAYLSHIWPTQFEHINVYGKYEFNLEAVRQRNGLRELRKPGL